MYNNNTYNNNMYNTISAVGTHCVYENKEEVARDTFKVSRFEHIVSGYDKNNSVTCNPFSRYCTLYAWWRKTPLRGHIDNWVVVRSPDGSSYEGKITTYRGKGYNIVVTVRNTVRYETRQD